MSISGLNEHQIALIKSWAQKAEGLLDLYAYGSRVKGTYVEGSDLDLAYRMRGEEGSDPTESPTKRDWQKALSEIVGIQVDLQHIGETDSVVWPAVKTYGVCLFRYESPYSE